MPTARFCPVLLIALSMGSVPTMTAAQGFPNPGGGTTCKDLTIELQGTSSDPSTQVLLYLDCLGGGSGFPEQTIIHYFRTKPGEVCHAHRVCGNIERWKVDVQIGARWTFGVSMGSALSSISASRSHGGGGSTGGGMGGGFGLPSGTGVDGRISVGRETVERSCAAQQDWECLDV